MPADHEADTAAWIPSTPAGIRPVPAAESTVRRGQRVIVGDPGYGWVGDLRADDPVEQSGRWYVPALPEADWYRAERDDIDVFAPLIPTARVWVEQLDPDVATELPRAGHMLDRLVDLTAPPARVPIPARDVPALTGRRVVVVGRDAHDHEVQHRDLRAVSEPYQTRDGAVCVRVTKEPDWYRSLGTGSAVLSNKIPVYLVWVE
jgi:hypothetical protein